MIRPCTFSDFPAIQRLNHFALGYDYSIEKTKKQLVTILSAPDLHCLLVYEEEATQEVIGYIHAQIYEPTYSDPLFNLLGVAVDSIYQRRGIGKELLIAVEEEARKRDITGIRLNSGSIRTEAHAFYEALGYKNTKEQKRFLKLL